MEKERALQDYLCSQHASKISHLQAELAQKSAKLMECKGGRTRIHGPGKNSFCLCLHNRWFGFRFNSWLTCNKKTLSETAVLHLVYSAWKHNCAGFLTGWELPLNWLPLSAKNHSFYRILSKLFFILPSTIACLKSPPYRIFLYVACS